jgi:hypothetical protein
MERSRKGFFGRPKVNPVAGLTNPGLRSGEETSSETLQQIQEEGLLANVSLAIYIGIHKHGPCTGGELAKAMQEDSFQHAGKGLADWLTPRAVRARLGELRDRDAVRELEPRKCDVTGRRVIVWEVSGRLPGPKPPKKLSKKDLLIKQLQGENAQLRARIRELEGTDPQPGLFGRLRSET